MSKKEIIEEKASLLLDPIVEERKFEAVDVEYVKEGSNWYLRAYIDKEGGITVDDCESVSRAWEQKLDEADLIKDPYILEVSSPGLGRPLKKEKDYARSLGKELELRTFKPIEHEKEFYGVLKAYDEATVTIETEEGKEMTFQRTDLALVRLAFDF